MKPRKRLEFTHDFLEDSRRFMISPEKSNYIYKYLGLKKHSKALDLGCGSGYFSRLMSKYLRNTGNVVGIDLNIKVFEKEKTLNKTTNIIYQCCDATNLPYPDETFDFTISHFLLSRINEEEVKKTLKEMHRVTRKGGIVASFEPCLGGMTAFFPDNEKLSSILSQIRLAKSSIEYELYGINENIGVYVPEMLSQLGLTKIKSELFGVPYLSPPPFPLNAITKDIIRWYKRRLSQFQRPNDNDVIEQFGKIKDASLAMRVVNDNDLPEELLKLYKIRGISAKDLLECQQARIQYIQNILENRNDGWVKYFELIPILMVTSLRNIS